MRSKELGVLGSWVGGRLGDQGIARRGCCDCKIKSIHEQFGSLEGNLPFSPTPTTGHSYRYAYIPSFPLEGGIHSA